VSFCPLEIEEISMLGIDLRRDVLDLADAVRDGLGVTLVMGSVSDIGVNTVVNGLVELLLFWCALCRALLRLWRARVVDQTLCSSCKILGGVGESTSRPANSPIEFW
jgi:hypothetical protein